MSDSEEVDVLLTPDPGHTALCGLPQSLQAKFLKG